MRPEVAYKRVPGGRVWHKFIDGADQPVCGIVSDRWYVTSGVARMRVHKDCERRCPWKPRLNRVITDEEIDRE